MQIKKYQHTPGPITKTYNMNPDYWDELNDEYWKDAGWRFMPSGEFFRSNADDKSRYDQNGELYMPGSNKRVLVDLNNLVVKRSQWEPYYQNKLALNEERKQAARHELNRTLPDLYVSNTGSTSVIDHFANQLFAPTASNVNSDKSFLWQADRQYELSKDKHDMDVKAADDYVHNLGMTQLDKTLMNNLVNLSLTLGGTAAAVPLAWMAPVAFAGGVAGGIAGDYLGNLATQRFSNGKYNTWGDAMQDWTNGYIRADNAAITNPGALLGGTIGGITTPLFTRSFATKLPNNWGTRLLYDASNQFGQYGINDAINDGRYVYNRRSLFDNVRRSMEDLKRIRDKVGDVVQEGEMDRFETDVFTKGRYESGPLYDLTNIHFWNLHTMLNNKGSMTAAYVPDKKLVEVPLYRHYRSNITADYSKPGFNYGGTNEFGLHPYHTAVHEFQHAASDTGRFKLDNFISVYGKDKTKPISLGYSLNRQHPLAKDLAPLSTMERKKRWIWETNPEEVASEMMAFRLDNGYLPRYHQMDATNQGLARLFIMKRFELSESDADNILTTLSKHGY